MPGREAILISHRHPRVGLTTDASPIINKDPANQNTCQMENWRLKQEDDGFSLVLICFSNISIQAFPPWTFADA